MNTGLHSKAILAALGAALTATTTALADGVLSGTDVGIIIGALIAGLGLTWAVPFANYFKLIAATAVAVVAALSTALADGNISGDEWYGVIGIIATVIATHTAPNAPATVSPSP